MPEFLLTIQNTGREPKFQCPQCGGLTSHKIAIYPLYPVDHGVQIFKNKPYFRVLSAQCLTCEKTSLILDEYLISSSEDKNAVPQESQAWREPNGSDLTIIGRTMNAPMSYSFQKLISQTVIFPDVSIGFPLPNADLSDGVKNLYNEASSIANKSPRGAMALLRLSLEKMLRHDFHKRFTNIYSGILALYEDGIPEEMDIALHYLRIAGNAADHEKPGLILVDGKEGTSTVKTMMTVINDIADEKITRKRRLQGLTQFISNDQIKGIQNSEDKIDNNK